MAKQAEATAPAAEVDTKAAKAAKFKELAEKRVTNALNAIRLIGNLSNKNNYVYTDAQIDKIGDALEQACTETLGAFAGKVIGSGFSLDEQSDTAEA